MSTRPGDDIYGVFTTQNPTSGAQQNADSLPTAVLVRNGDDTMTAVTVTNTGTGRYKAETTVPSAWNRGDDVAIRVTATVAGVEASDIIWQESLAPESSGPSASYCTRTQMEDIYGVTNIEKWADLDNDGDATKISNRISRAITRSTSEIDDRLRGCQYSIPFTVVPSVIEYCCALYAGIWLYSNRGVIDYDANGNAQDQLQYQRKEFDEKIRMIIAGKVTLEISSNVTITFPFAVND